MYIQRLQLTNYRNYKTLDLAFDEGVNIFIGQNAQGKTNIMESIYVLALAKSHRTSNDKELIQWGEEYGKIGGTIEKKNGRLPLELILSTRGKKARVNHLEQAKLSSYIGQLNVIMFAPEDLDLVKGSPQHRRRFLDMEIGQISPSYLHDLVIFQKLLKERNALLKESRKTNRLDEAMFDVYTEQYVEVAVKVIKKRFEFIELLTQWAQPIHDSISKGKEQLKLEYITVKDFQKEWSHAKMKEQMNEQLFDLRRREVDRGITMIGPHRDDIRFYVNDYDVQTYGSQGQQRTTALSVKLAEIELVKQEVGEPPILLLDDVLSELDADRQSHLLHAMESEVQTFVTTTSIAGIDHTTVKEATVFEVEDGSVRKIESEDVEKER